jgi:hypothetical protein
VTTKTPRPTRKTHTALRALALGACLAALPASYAAPTPVEIAGAWARATPPGVETGAAYCRIVNRGAADRLLGARSPAARSVELHTTTRDPRGVETMAHAAELPIAAGATVELAPGGTHMMLVGLKAPLVADTPIEVTLVFAKAGEIVVTVPVIDVRSTPPGGQEQHAH